MKRKIVGALFLLAIAVISLSNTARIASNGAPIGSTGAPGEETCAKSGCHAGTNNLNTGVGKLTLEIPELNTQYVPGQKYQVTVRMEQKDIQRFGFSLSILNAQGQSAGNLVITDFERTQIMNGVNQFSERDYITYQSVGTAPYSKNIGQWSFEWQAPPTDEGPLTIYYAAVSANNDGTDNGDEVYTDSLTLESLFSSVQKQSGEGAFEVFPNPTSKQFTLTFYQSERGATKGLLYDSKGHEVLTLFDETFFPGEQRRVVEMPAGLSAGIYFISIQQPSGTQVQKIILE